MWNHSPEDKVRWGWRWNGVIRGLADLSLSVKTLPCVIKSYEHSTQALMDYSLTFRGFYNIIVPWLMPLFLLVFQISQTKLLFKEIFWCCSSELRKNGIGLCSHCIYWGWSCESMVHYANFNLSKNIYSHSVNSQKSKRNSLPKNDSGEGRKGETGWKLQRGKLFISHSNLIKHIIGKGLQIL